MKLSRLSFLVPAYNDAKTTASLIHRIGDVAKNVATTCEIRIVNDASTDQTAKILSTLVSLDKRINVTTHRENKGYGQTLKELYSSATYDWMFSVPGDYQIDPHEIIKLIPYIDTMDMIIGWRKNRHDPFLRRVQSKVYNMGLFLLLGLSLQDANSVRLMNKKLMESVQLRSDSAFVDAELALEANKKEFRITEIPILHKKREGSIGGGGKLNTIFFTIRDMLYYRFRFAR